MFTGLISATTPVKNSQHTPDGLQLTFARPAGWDDLELGESINTNGACLTIAALRENEYDCLLMPETLAKTTFGTKIPQSVNLERALRVGDRLGGGEGRSGAIGGAARSAGHLGRRSRLPRASLPSPLA